MCVSTQTIVSVAHVYSFRMRVSANNLAIETNKEKEKRRCVERQRQTISAIPQTDGGANKFPWLHLAATNLPKVAQLYYVTCMVT